MSKHLVSLVYRKKIGSMMRKAVFSYMADRANDDGTGIWSAKGTIANEIEASRQGVINTIKGLVKDGLLVEVGPRKCANGHTMEYRIDVEKLDALPASTCKKIDTSKSVHVNGVDTDPSTPCTPPVNDVDTNRPEPSKEPSKRARVEKLVDEVRGRLPKKKKALSRRKSLARVLPGILKEVDEATLLRAIELAYSQPDQVKEDGQYATAIYTFLNEGMWRDWVEEVEGLAEITENKFEPTGRSTPDGRREYREAKTGRLFAYSDKPEHQDQGGREYLDGGQQSHVIPFIGNGRNSELGTGSERNTQKNLPGLQSSQKGQQPDDPMSVGHG